MMVLNHWETGLRVHFNSAASNKIKEVNSIQARIKAVTEVWTTEREYSIDANVIDLTINAKLSEEGLDVSGNTYKQTIQECMVASNDIIQSIASESSDYLTKYVNLL